MHGVSSRFPSLRPRCRARTDKASQGAKGVRPGGVCPHNIARPWTKVTRGMQRIGGPTGLFPCISRSLRILANSTSSVARRKDPPLRFWPTPAPRSRRIQLRTPLRLPAVSSPGRRTGRILPTNQHQTPTWQEPTCCTFSFLLQELVVRYSACKVGRPNVLTDLGVFFCLSHKRERHRDEESIPVARLTDSCHSSEDFSQQTYLLDTFQNQMNRLAETQCSQYGPSPRTNGKGR